MGSPSTTQHLNLTVNIFHSISFRPPSHGTGSPSCSVPHAHDSSPDRDDGSGQLQEADTPNKVVSDHRGHRTSAERNNSGTDHELENEAFSPKTNHGLHFFTRGFWGLKQDEAILKQKVSILKTLDKLDTKIKSDRAELEIRRQAGMDSRERNDRELELLRGELDRMQWLATRKMESVRIEHCTSTALHPYARHVRRASPTAATSNYLTILEAKVCRASHQLTILTSQEKHQKISAESLKQWMTAALHAQKQEKIEAERALLDRLFCLNGVLRSLESDHKYTLKRQMKKIEKLKLKLFRTSHKKGSLEWIREELLEHHSNENEISMKEAAVPAPAGQNHMRQRRRSSVGHSLTLSDEIKKSLRKGVVEVPLQQKHPGLDSMSTFDSGWDATLVYPQGETYDDVGATGYAIDEVVLGTGIDEEESSSHVLVLENILESSTPPRVQEGLDDETDRPLPYAAGQMHRRMQKRSTMHL